MGFSISKEQVFSKRAFRGWLHDLRHDPASAIFSLVFVTIYGAVYSIQLLFLGVYLGVHLPGYLLHRWHERRNRPKPLKYSRRRALTLPLRPPPTGPLARIKTLLPLSSSSREQPQTFQQTQSTFIARVPLEIRLQIYHEIFSEKTITISPICMPSKDEEYQDFIPSKYHLALLRTCRIIYTETHPLLYNTTLINLPTDHTLDSFQKRVLPSRWQMIRRISIPVHVAPIWKSVRHGCVRRRIYTGKFRGVDEWKHTAYLLAHMDGLQEVILRIRDETINCEANSLAVDVLGHLAKFDVHGGVIRLFSEYDYYEEGIAEVLEEARTALRNWNVKSRIECVDKDEWIRLRFKSRLVSQGGMELGEAW